MSDATPLITCAICTRNRADMIVPTIESILTITYPRFELLIVDQSTNQQTADAVKEYLEDSRIRYIHTDAIGLSHSRNEAIEAAKSEIIVFTDDDCMVPPEWPSVMAEIFGNYPKLAIAFCNVFAPDYDPKAGFIPDYRWAKDTLLTDIRMKCRARGIGAGLTVRKSHIEAIGGFDTMLGAGAFFPSCEDGDMAVRALLKGYHVYETAQTNVLHFGFRYDWEGRRQAWGDFYAIAAAYVKPLKCGYGSAWVVLAYEFWFEAVIPIWAQAIRFKRPRGLTRIPAFLRGIMDGLRTPVNRTTLLFEQREKTGGSD